MTHAVAVTGMGVVSPNGVGNAEFHAAQLAARSGVDTITRYECADDDVRVAGEVRLPDELTLERREQVRADRCTQLAAAAAALAVDDADMSVEGQIDLERTGVSIGSAMGGATAIEDNLLAYFKSGPRAVRSRGIPMSMNNSASAWVAIRYGITGPCLAVSTACASGADAIVSAYQMIASGEVDVVLAGGAEAPVVRSVVSGFAKMGALSTRNGEPAGASRPFSKDRDGFVIAEGAAVLLLESEAHARARGARVHAYLSGYGRSSDAHHATMPHPEGIGARQALRRALRSADAQPCDVGMVNSHGTSTPLNDIAEAVAIRDVFGSATDSVPVTATKSLIGHSLGAAGAIEAVATVQALAASTVPPTANVDDLDPEIDLDVVRGTPRRGSMALALSNSFAFGGHNVVLAFSSAGSPA